LPRLKKNKKYFLSPLIKRRIKMSRVTPTDYMIKLKEKMMEERATAESTANTYIANLVLLNDKKAFNNLGFLKKNKDAILEHLTEYADSTEQNYLSAIVSSL
jgi:hypothetical protein